MMRVVLAVVALMAAFLVPVWSVAQAAPVTGNATHFDALGSPYGGCGLPQAELDSQHFVALNVLNTPGDYSSYARPIPASQASKIGAYDNGRNCGRYVRVTVGDFCTGTNDGAPGQPFCRNGSWTADGYNGATLTMLVADSCADANAWCRDDPHHLDLAKPSVNQFQKNGTPVGDLLDHWNNRHVSWEYVPAPDYTGDIRVGFLQGAQRWWPAIAVSHLADGIHGVEYYANGSWQPATMNGDMGQSYIIGGLTSGGTDFKIRVRDAADTLINNGRVYAFSLPSSCSSQCGQPYTPATYTTDDTTPTPSPTSPTTSAPPTSCVTPTWTVASSWTGGYLVNVTVTNCGTTPTFAWQTTWTFPGAQTVASYWGTILTQSGTSVSASSQLYNGAIQPGASTTFGLVINGPDQPPINLKTTTPIPPPGT